MATSLRLFNILQQNRSRCLGSSKLLIRNFKIAHVLQRPRSIFGVYIFTALWQQFKCTQSVEEKSIFCKTSIIYCQWITFIYLKIRSVSEACQILPNTTTVLTSKRCFSSAQTEPTTKGKVDKHEFKAETRMLLDIVARSLYSENEVFVRELVSNASDALEKFRYTIQTAGDEQSLYEGLDRPLEIHLITNKQESTLTIKDTGIGKAQCYCDFSHSHLKLNSIIFSVLLGRNDEGRANQSFGNDCQKWFEKLFRRNQTGRHCRWKCIKHHWTIWCWFLLEFVSFHQKRVEFIYLVQLVLNMTIILCSMVAERVEVLTKSSKVGSVGLKWISDGTGSYEIEEIDGVDVGTTIVLHLKNECREYADEERIKCKSFRHLVSWTKWKLIINHIFSGH